MNESMPLNSKQFRLGLGTGGLSDQKECVETVEKALNVGYRHIDTAIAYGNEPFIREAIDRADVSREDVILATKVRSDNLSKQDVISETEESRERLGVEQIDLLYVHWPAHTYDAEETMAAFSELKQRGWIRNIGVCNFTLPLLQEAETHLSKPVDAIQVEFHPLWKQDEIHRYARDNDVWLVAYSPMAKGNALLVPEITDIATEKGITAAQVCLAWLLHKEMVAPIPHSSGEHLIENYEALSTELTAEEVARIDAISDRGRFTDYGFAPWN